MRSFVVAIFTVSSLSLLALRTDSFSTDRAISPSKGVSRQAISLGPTKFESWKRRWRDNILRESQHRYCATEMGEEIGWIISPLLTGFYYGYLATAEMPWVEKFVDCTDRWIGRAVMEPDGYVGWPKLGAAGTDVDDLDSFYADSLLGEAMVLGQVAQMSAVILSTPALKARYGAKVESYMKLSRSIFEKWDKRGAWRRTEGDGIISVVLPFGIDPETGRWTDGYSTRDSSAMAFHTLTTRPTLLRPGC